MKLPDGVSLLAVPVDRAAKGPRGFDEEAPAVPGRLSLRGFDLDFSAVHPHDAHPHERAGWQPVFKERWEVSFVESGDCVPVFGSDRQHLKMH